MVIWRGLQPGLMAALLLAMADKQRSGGRPAASPRDSDTPAPPPRRPANAARD